MNNAVKKAFGLFFLLLSITLISCEEEEYVNQDVIVDPVPVDTTDTSTVDPVDCSADFFLFGPPINPADSGIVTYVNYAQISASLFAPSCAEVSAPFNSNHHLVIYSNSFAWGANGPQVGFSSNGFQGIELTSSSPFAAGNTYELLGDVFNFNNMIQVPGGGFLQTYEMLNTAVTLNEVGDAVGESISGTLLCTLQASDGTQTTVTGTFCSPIVDFCN